MKRKNLTKSILLGISLLVYIGCHDVKIGYLETRNAVYIPDSLVIKSKLDEVKDAKRVKFQIPWQSTSIEGIQGTMPIHYEIREIKSDNGFSNAIDQIQVVRKGIFEIPYNHTLPKGRYIIDLVIWNEGYSVNLDSIYTLIVE